MANREKAPDLWQQDIDRSVDDYNDWYLNNSPRIWADARGKAVTAAAAAMSSSGDFRKLTAGALRAHPQSLAVARHAVSPVMARDRLVGFTGVSPNLVKVMEQDNKLPARGKTIDADLGAFARLLSPRLDPGLFPWLQEDRGATPEERDKALLVLGERLARAFYDPELRNGQEHRQKALMAAFLTANGFEEAPEEPFLLPPKTFGMGRNVLGIREDGQAQNLPTDCVIRPESEELPLVCLEMKSAGDFTNVNKRRKEESDKHAALQRAQGETAIMLLQLFGYFDRNYLGFEASAGLDWAWDHRLEDLAPFLGL